MGTNVCKQTLKSICNKCNTAQNPNNACTSTSSTNNVSNEKACSYYCNTGCNTTCVSIQNLCKVNQYIKKYVGNFPISSIKGHANSKKPGEEDIIKNKWTAYNWNLAISQLEEAEKIGGLETQGTGPKANTVSTNEVIKATTFNELRNKIYHFVVDDDISCSIVKGLSTDNKLKLEEADIITAAKANALRDAYQNAKFNTSVCDICNAAGNQNSENASCGCNCTCACSCSCGCPSCGGCSCPVCGGCSCPVCGGCSCPEPTSTQNPDSEGAK